MKRLLLLLMCAISLSLSADDDVRPLLLGYEWQVELGNWQREQVPQLIEISQDNTEMLFIRKRALAALGQINSDEARLALGQVIHDATQPGLQRRAIDIVCPTGGKPSDDGVLETLIVALERPDEQLRFRAASCLSTLAHIKKVGAALDQYYLRAADWERQELSKH